VQRSFLRIASVLSTFLTAWRPRTLPKNHVLLLQIKNGKLGLAQPSLRFDQTCSPRAPAAGMPKSDASLMAQSSRGGTHGKISDSRRCIELACAFAIIGERQCRRLFTTSNPDSPDQSRRDRAVLARRTRVGPTWLACGTRLLWPPLLVRSPMGAAPLLRDDLRGCRARHDRHCSRSWPGPAAAGSEFVLVLGRSVSEPRLLGLLLLDVQARTKMRATLTGGVCRSPPSSYRFVLTAGSRSL
jgi:hypothetical protein